MDLKHLLKRGALLAAANWQTVAIQFIAQTTFQVLLAAESFGDLLSRYKYLYLTSEQDRALVTDVEKLRNRVVHQRKPRAIVMRAMRSSQR